MATKKAAKKTTARKKPVDAVSAAEKTFFGSKDDHPEDRSVSSRRRVHDEVSDQIDAYLSGGGSIHQIDAHVTAEANDKGSGRYGSRPI